MKATRKAMVDNLFSLGDKLMEVAELLESQEIEYIEALEELRTAVKCLIKTAQMCQKLAISDGDISAALDEDLLD